MVFAKNSDRPVGEVQPTVLFDRRASAGCTLRTQYLSIGSTVALSATGAELALIGAENEYQFRNAHVFTMHLPDNRLT